MDFNKIILNIKPTLSLYLYDVNLIPKSNIINDLQKIKELVLISFDVLVSDDFVNAEQKIRRIGSKRENINKKNINHILKKIGLVRKNKWHESVIHREYYVEHLIIKLITHLISPYTNEDYKKIRKQHIFWAQKFSDIFISSYSNVGLILVGSLLDENSYTWHPFYSDVDIIPLQKEKNIDYTEIQNKFNTFDKPKWLYINYGGKKGIGGLKDDPLKSMYVTNEVPLLSDVEVNYLYDLFNNGYRFLGGDIYIIDSYFIEINKCFSKRKLKIPSLKSFIDNIKDKSNN
jgi:hypothetical protein